MSKLHSLAFYTLVTPVITLGAGSLLAQEPAGQDDDRGQQSTQRDQDASQSTTRSTQNDQSTQRAGQSDSQQRAGQSDSQSAAGRLTAEQSRTQNRGYMDSTPANGMQASNLIGASVTTTGDENLGSVGDLIIDEDGQVVAIVVGVGGFLGLGEKEVAIGWDDVMRSGTADEQELRIDATREDLRSAPEFEAQEAQEAQGEQEGQE